MVVSDEMDVLYGKTDRSRSTIIGADAWFNRWNAERFNLTEECAEKASGTMCSPF